MMKISRLAVLSLVGLSVSTMAMAAEVSLRADLWYPMNGVPGSANPGYMVEVAKEALAAGGHTINYQNMPWERAVTEVRAGKFDCAIGAYKEDAPDFVYPDEELGRDVQAFYVKKGNAWKYTGDINALKSISLGVIGGYAYGEEFDKFLESAGANSNVQVINADNALEQNLKKLQAGRITATLESVYVAEAKLKEMNLSGQIEAAGLFGEPTPMYIACSPAKPSSKEYAKLLGDGVKKMRASGKLKSILDKYGLKDWK